MVLVHGSVNVDAIRKVAAQILKELQEKKGVAWVMDYGSEIDLLEETLSYLEMAMDDVADTPYHSHLKGHWEEDMREIQERLGELYKIQNEEWEADMRQLNKEFERDRI